MRHAPSRLKAPCVGLQYGLPVGLLARRTNLPPALPTKPSYVGEPGYIPLREIEGWTCVMIEISYRVPALI